MLSRAILPVVLSLLLVLAVSPVNAENENSQAVDRSLQRTFLQTIVDDATPVSIFLVDGFKLNGVITDFDDGTLLVGDVTSGQLVFLNAIVDIVLPQVGP